MKNLESPKVAEAKQRRKLQYLPPVWPLIVGVAIIVVIVVALHH